jgi:Na+/melibiose symporter-like transporter
MKMIYPAYGSLGFALSVVGIPLFMYLPTFYASDVGIDVATVGMILLVARSLDMLLDPLIGHASDHLGKRKPFILTGSFVLLIGYYFLIHPSFAPQAWLFVFSMMVYIGWSLITVPYMALSSEITSDYHEKTTLSSWREVMAISGMMCALLLPYMLAISDNNGATLQSLYLLLLISLPIALLLLVWKVPQTTSLQQNVPFISGIKIIFKSNAALLVGAYFLNALANAIPSTLFLYYVSHILKSPEKSGLLLLLYFASGIIALPFWNALARRLGKKHSWMISMALACIAFSFIPFLGTGDLSWFILIVLFSGFSLGADLVLSSSLQADLAQRFALEGKPLSGVLFGLWGMGTKLSLALGVGIAFGVLGLFDFTPNSPTSQSLGALVFLYGLAPVFLKIMSITVLWRYKEMN